jgi:hypothetical protein
MLSWRRTICWPTSSTPSCALSDDPGFVVVAADGRADAEKRRESGGLERLAPRATGRTRPGRYTGRSGGSLAGSGDARRSGAGNDRAGLHDIGRGFFLHAVGTDGALIALRVDESQLAILACSAQNRRRAAGFRPAASGRSWDRQWCPRAWYRSDCRPFAHRGCP